MGSLTAEDLESGVVCAFAEDLLSGDVQELTIRPGSRQHFFAPFLCAGYEVQLRLDWTDLDEKHNPSLDADFYHADTGAMDKTMKEHPAHHTGATTGGERVYRWEFADQSRHLQITLTWRKSVSSRARVQPSVTSRVIRAGDD